MSLLGTLRKGVRALGRMLVGEGLATDAQISEALAEQERRRRGGQPHKPIGEILVERSVVTRGDLERVLSRQECALEICSREADGGVCILDLRGYVDGDTHDVLDTAFERLVRARRTRLVVNATQLAYMNSDGVGAILGHAREARLAGGDIKLCGLHGKAAALFEVIGLNSFFQCFASEPEALAAFARPVPEEFYKEPELLYVAARAGAVFHLRSCPLARRIRVVNALRFFNREEAERAGKKPCARCCRGAGSV